MISNTAKILHEYARANYSNSNMMIKCDDTDDTLCEVQDYDANDESHLQLYFSRYRM